MEVNSPFRQENKTIEDKATCYVGYVLFHKSVNMWRKALLRESTKNSIKTVRAQFPVRTTFVVLHMLSICPKTAFMLKPMFKEVF